MKFALICDSSGVNSYYCKSGLVYDLKTNKPYYRNHHIKNECMMGFWNYPALFDGHFINMNDMSLPDMEFDCIFAAIEKDARNLDKIRIKYPKSKIFGTIKERNANRELRNYVIKSSDGFVVPYLHYDFIKEQDLHNSGHIYKIPQPVNIDYLHQHFMCRKSDAIFDYGNYWATGRSGKNAEFLRSVNFKSIHATSEQWDLFVNEWNSCRYLANLDPTHNFGQQATQCAALGVVVLGGQNDSHKILYPKLATQNIEELLRLFKELRTNYEFYSEIGHYAYDKVNELYSFDKVRSQIENLML